MAPRNTAPFTPQEDATILFQMERIVVSEGRPTKVAFKEIADMLENRPDSAVKKRWENIRNQATGKLAEWVKKNNRGKMGNIPVLEPVKRTDRASLISIIALANTELEGIDKEIADVKDQLARKKERKLELQKNLSEKTNELSEMLRKGITENSAEEVKDTEPANV